MCWENVGMKGYSVVGFKMEAARGEGPESWSYEQTATLNHQSVAEWESQAAAAAAKSLQSCLTVWPHRWQPTRLPRPWDSPGMNTGVGCHFLLQCMKVKSENEAAQLCPTLSEPMDCSLPGSSINGKIFQARVLEWVAIAFSESQAIGDKQQGTGFS